MDILTGLSVSFALLSLFMGLLFFRSERQVRRLIKRCRSLNERLEAVEKFNGLNSTNTDIRANR